MTPGILGAAVVIGAQLLAGLCRHHEHASQRNSVAGTYRIVLCKNAECAVGDTTRALGWGYLVLTDRTLPQAVHRQFPDSFLDGDPNGCFSLRRREPSRTLAGIDREALTRWEQNGAKLSFTLFSAPDGGHGVNVMVSGDTLHGTGTSWESSGDGRFTTDFVRAVRIGPPDLQRCHKTTRAPTI